MAGIKTKVLMHEAAKMTKMTMANFATTKVAGKADPTTGDPTRIVHNFMAEGEKLRPLATRTGDMQTIDEVWVGTQANMKLLGLAAVTTEIIKDIANDQVFITYRFIFNGAVLLEHVYSVDYGDQLDELVRERVATIGELK